MNKKHLAIGIVVGAVVGYIIGLLVVPQSGKETREWLADKAKDIIKRGE